MTKVVSITTKQKQRVGIPYFPAAVDATGRPVVVCPACGHISYDAGTHWGGAGHHEDDVTAESRNRAYVIADALLGVSK